MQDADSKESSSKIFRINILRQLDEIYLSQVSESREFTLTRAKKNFAMREERNDSAA
jgi:hypothetical protein